LIEPVKEWSDDEWYLDQEQRKFIKGSGFSTIQRGEADGKIIGGNLSTFTLLNGTTFLPDMSNTVLFLEDDADTNPRIFDRMLQSVLHQKGFDGIRALVIGRFQNGSNINNKILRKIISTKKELKDIPIIADVDCGHATPQITFPIGGTCRVISEQSPRLEIIKH
jgi:muramoyltetrapeptide carboxypeptidase LdcA involved in peptidoglycan recycling